jgi:hypothetical protein
LRRDRGSPQLGPDGLPEKVRIKLTFLSLKLTFLSLKLTFLNRHIEAQLAREEEAAAGTGEDRAAAGGARGGWLAPASGG